MKGIYDLPINDDHTSYYRGPKSDHFDGKKFFNPWNSAPNKNFWDFLKWQMERKGKKAEWPKKWPTQPISAPERFSDSLKVTYIGHASFLVQVSGKNILIDPVFSDRAGPFSKVGPKRVTKPAFDMSDLPPIHAVFVSHNHFDHMDLISLSWLARNHTPHFYTPLGNPRLIKPVVRENPITALDWHDVAELGDGVTLTLTPSQHWSRRRLHDTNRDLWGGCFIKDTRRSTSLYYPADSGFHEELFKDIYERHGVADIALLPIGAYEPRWFMAYSHMNPEEAVKVHKILNAKKSMGFHFEVFQLTDEAFDDPRKHTIEKLMEHEVTPMSFMIPSSGDCLTV